MTIKNYKELNLFEKEGAMSILKQHGCTFASATDIETNRIRTVVEVIKGISFDLDSMIVEVD